VLNQLKNQLAHLKSYLHPPLKNGLKESGITKLNREFDSLFEKSKNAIREDRDSYLKLYNALIVVK